MPTSDPLRLGLQALAQQAMRNATATGTIPKAATRQCALCPRQAAAWHHYKGYRREHWLTVVALCDRCHYAEHARMRRGEQVPNDAPWLDGSAHEPLLAPDVSVDSDVLTERDVTPEPYTGPLSERTTLIRARPPWPGVLPLAEAAAFLGMQRPALRQRWRRGKQPGYFHGDRVFIVLLPAQWAAWAVTRPAVHPLESALHLPGTAGVNGPHPRSPGGWTTAPGLEAMRLRWLRQLEAETAEKAYWRDVALTMETELAAARRAVHLLTEREAPPEQRALPAVQSVQSVQSVQASWWQRVLAWAGLAPLQRVVPAPGPSQREKILSL